ncbi:MAG TPA: methylenetetrahydrofolate reductase C-terminal domain-containing protein [Sedimentisphaerales bacterium]|nr:methylenetetrahydrofolate reductase C-terminal domain-containing protein [Sedimentisphaerales bacterium]HRS13181.1 methylenetetrahydrofolate reductase C-terminal domain-containing protein [Sedimentisphaerales bacterium]HRV49936.1 methylenetetrahydrofolate reductase C-terminal domain-containing protein [Sedimentisphaerales bacterium]
MERNSLGRKLRQRSGLLVLAELVGGPGFSFAPIERFGRAYQEAAKAGRAVLPEGFDFAAITLPQNPGGVANLEPAAIVNVLEANHLLDGLDIVPHISCKDANADAIVSSLVGFRKAGVTSVLALTGDKPVAAKGVFELESLGLLRLIRKMNHDAYLGAKPDALASVHQFVPGAAVSPFKYTEATQMQQYYKMEKKVRCGAAFLVTQVGWDWRKSLELFTYLKDRQIDVPVIGNVYLLSTLTPAPRLMHDIKLTGCFVSDELLAKVYSEKLDDHIERAAQQVAMYKAMGAAGVDIGGVQDFATFTRIVERAAEIGSDWERFKDNLCWPPRSSADCGSQIVDSRPAGNCKSEIRNPKSQDAFYLYDDHGRARTLSQLRPTAGKRFFDFSHRALLDPEGVGFHAFRRTMGFLGADKGEGLVYKLFNAGEKAFKYTLFDCEECGDCFLPENFGVCTMGGCEKGIDNAPCGDATVDGYCGNNLRQVCVGNRIYEAAASEKGGRQRLRTTINPRRNPALQHSSSILNYLFGKDHTMKNALISIGEAVHASIPKTGQVMRRLQDLGPDAYTKPGPELDYVKALIESQAADHADYIAVNLDAFGEDDPTLAVKMMIEYTRLVRRWGDGVPICIDSSNDDVLEAGLREWYAAGANPCSPVKPPLINSVKVYTMDRILPLKRQYDFSVIALLVSEDRPTGPGGSHSVDELCALAHRIFDEAVGRYGFRPEQIFFDSTVFPLAIDMPMEPGVPGYTYRTFETIKRIKSDPKFKGAHFSLGVSNSVRDLPGRKIGVCRAYVAKAMEYGLDAGIVNTAHKYGTVEPDPALLELVDAFAHLDGSLDKTGKAMELMGKFCQENRKPS